MEQKQKNPFQFEIQIPFEGHNSLRFFAGEIISLTEDFATLKIESLELQVGEKIKLQLSSQGAGYDAHTLECLITEKHSRKNQSWVIYQIKYTSFDQSFWPLVCAAHSTAA